MPFKTSSFAANPLLRDMKLDWGAIAGATTYTIYRDTNPLFTPGPSNQIGTSSTNTFTDVGAVSLPVTKYFYNVTSSAGSGPAAFREPGNKAVTTPTTKGLDPNPEHRILRR